MANQYDEILRQILDPSSPDPTVVVWSQAHFNILRAGLSASKKAYNTLMAITGGKELKGVRFTYTPDPQDGTLVTISLAVGIPATFEIVNPRKSGVNV